MKAKGVRPGAIIMLLVASAFVSLLSATDDLYGYVFFAARTFWTDVIFTFVRLFSTPLPFIGLAVAAGYIARTWKGAVFLGFLSQLMALVPYYLVETVSGYRPEGSGGQLLFQAALWLAAGTVLSFTISPLACYCRSNFNPRGQAGTGFICGVIVGGALPMLLNRFEWTFGLFPLLVALAAVAFLGYRLRYPHRIALLIPFAASIAVAFCGLSFLWRIGY